MEADKDEELQRIKSQADADTNALSEEVRPVRARHTRMPRVHAHTHARALAHKRTRASTYVHTCTRNTPTLQVDMCRSQIKLLVGVREALEARLDALRSRLPVY